MDYGLEGLFSPYSCSRASTEVGDWYNENIYLAEEGTLG